jgi:hypothetical protein
VAKRAAIGCAEGGAERVGEAGRVVMIPARTREIVTREGIMLDQPM